MKSGVIFSTIGYQKGHMTVVLEKICTVGQIVSIWYSDLVQFVVCTS